MGLLDDVEDQLGGGGDERTRYEYECDDCGSTWRTTVSPSIARCTACDGDEVTVRSESDA
jgi:Zn finger protein HypA/HybF involved in hydrogenase expression